MDVQRLELYVPSIHCQNCLRTITRVVSQLPAVEHVEGNPTQKRVTVFYRGGSDVPETIRQAINQAGFSTG